MTLSTANASESKTTKEIILIDEKTGKRFSYEPESQEDYELIAKRARRDNDGNFWLPMPIVASFVKWSPRVAMQSSEDYVDDLGLMEIAEPKQHGKEIDISNIHNCTNQQLEEMLGAYGGFRAYLDAQISYIEAKKTVLQATFEEGLARDMYRLSQENEKRVNKDLLRGEAISKNPQLRNLRRELIETESTFVRLSGIRNGYKSAYDAISRVVALRTSSREMV